MYFLEVFYLNIGEKQRIQLARLFYHKPNFAILDEATSAVSTDVEALIYNTAKESGITLITISHRPSLMKYHLYLLELGVDSNHGYEFKQIGTPDALFQSVELEAQKLSTKMKSLEGLPERLAAINRELGITERQKSDPSKVKRTLLDV